jgi:hypothetical protein
MKRGVNIRHVGASRGYPRGKVISSRCATQLINDSDAPPQLLHTVFFTTGNKRVTVEVPEDVPIERIMVVLVERLMLPKYSPQGDFV